MSRRRYKKIFSLLFILMIACIATHTSVSGSVDKPVSYIHPSPSPMSLYISWTSTRLAISAYGSAELAGQITGIPGVTTRVAIYLYLEIYTNGTWSIIFSKYQSYNSYLGSLQMTIPVSSGHSYRVRASYYAFCDSTFENLIRFSSIVNH